MVGTVICRNCDTAIEVSEGDVARFQSNPTFDCPVCKQSLSQRMVDLIGGSPLLRTEEQEEFTQPDDQEAFQGLPVGGSFDEAASRLKTARAPRGAARAPAAAAAPAPAPEDPATLALRLAAQATAHAESLARAGGGAGASANGAEVEPPTGVMPTWRPPATNGRSTDAGVVPEEPENEPTARGGGPEVDHTETTEPTMPSPIAPSQSEEPIAGAALPEAPVNELTPALSRPRRPEPTPPADRPVLDEPVPEVTIRKSTPPAAVRTASPMRTTTPRTGTGPAGIGALGIRVVQIRSVVRPSFNGRAAPMPASLNDTQISGSHEVRDRPSGSMSALTPERPVRAGSRPRWMYLGVGVLGLVIVGGAIGVAVNHSHGSSTPYPTPLVADLTTTALAVETPTTMVTAVATATLHVAATHAAPTPTEPIAPVTHAAPTPTAMAVVTSRPAPTPTAIVTHTPAPTPVVISTTPQTPAPTRVAMATPRPTPKPAAGWQSHLDTAQTKYEQQDIAGAMTEVWYVHNHDPGEEPQFQAFVRAFKYGRHQEARAWGEEFLAKFPSSSHAAQVKSQIAMLPP